MTITALPIALGVATSGMTYLGGRLAIRYAARLPMLVALTAGMVLGVVLFDLLPASLHLAADAHPPLTVLGMLAIGMMIYMLLDRTLAALPAGPGRLRPHLGPASLSLHSIVDGMEIGLGFQVSTGLGIVIAAAVLAHDLADGANAVGLTRAAGRPQDAHRWLLANSAAPVLGVAAGQLIRVSDGTLALLLAGFAGAFLYIGACELLPRSQAESGSRWATLVTACGLAVMFGAVRLARL